FYTSFASGSPVYFTVATDGTVDYAPALEGALSGRGTATLRINGLAVTLDARALGVGSLVLDYAGYDATAPVSRRLLPGQHFISIASVVYYFTVADNGTLDYNAALDGILSGRGTSILVFLLLG